MVLGGGTFGRYLGHKEGALMNGITALIRRGQRVPMIFLPLCELNKKNPTIKQGADLSRH